MVLYVLGMHWLKSFSLQIVPRLVLVVVKWRRLLGGQRHVKR